MDERRPAVLAALSAVTDEYANFVVIMAEHGDTRSPQFADIMEKIKEAHDELRRWALILSANAFSTDGQRCSHVPSRSTLHAWFRIKPGPVLPCRLLHERRRAA